MIRLRKLTLENFLSHRETELPFQDETYVILGENASGKTSILRGIFFALFGEDLKGGKREQLINRRANASTVTLEFIHRESSYRVVRELSVKRKTATLYRDGRLIARGIREVNGVISEQLGLAPEMFKNTVFVPQGEIVELLKGRPQERRKILNRLLGLEEFGKKHQELKEEIKKLKGFEKVLESKFLSLEGVEREIEEEEKKLRALNGELSRLEKEVEELQKSLKKEREEFEELRQLKEEFERLKEKLSQVKGERERLRKRREEIEKKLKAIEEKKREIPTLKEEIKLLEPCLELQKIGRELALTAKDRERAEDLFRRLKEEVKKREELERELPLLEEKLKETQASLKQLKEKRKEVETEVKRLKEAEKAFRETSLKENSLKEQIERLKKNLPSVKPEELKALEEELKKLEEEEERLRQTVEKSRTKVEELKERLKLLEREGANCPVCGGELPPQKRKRLKRESEEEIERRVRELKEAEEKLREVKGKLSEVKKRVEAVSGELQLKERTEKEIERLKKEFSQLRKVEFKEEELLEKEKLLEKLKGKEAEAEKEIALLNARLKEVKLQLSKLPKQEELKRVEEELRELSEREKELKRKAAEIKEKNGINVGTLGELERLLKELQKKKERLDRVEGEVKSEGEFRELLKQLNREERELSEREAETASEVEKLNFKENLFLAAERALRSAEETLREKAERLNRIKGELKSRKENLERLKEKREELEKAKRNLSKVRDSLYVLQKVQETVHPERGFLKEVRNMLLPRIAFYCKEFFSAFDFEFGDLFISEDLSVEFGMPGQGTMLLEDLSGGQQVAFALALRFAMARNFSQSMELLVLDEPTVHLDAQRRTGLTELLLKLKTKIPQMLIVTHDPELEVAGDRVIRVKNHGGYSVVETGA